MEYSVQLRGITFPVIHLRTHHVIATFKTYIVGKNLSRITQNVTFHSQLYCNFVRKLYVLSSSIKAENVMISHSYLNGSI